LAAGTEQRPAFYALRPGGWRDLVTLLHPPYTLWHLSYVAIGAAAAPQIYSGRLAAALAAFFLAVGVGAHSLDELHGRPLGTHLSKPVLVALAAGGLGGGIAIGIAGMFVVSLTLAPLVAAGGFLVLAYNLELLVRRGVGRLPRSHGLVVKRARLALGTAGDRREHRGPCLLLAQRRPAAALDAGAGASAPN
jgi:hypothetical protein